MQLFARQQLFAELRLAHGQNADDGDDADDDHQGHHAVTLRGGAATTAVRLVAKGRSHHRRG